MDLKTIYHLVKCSTDYRDLKSRVDSHFNNTPVTVVDETEYTQVKSDLLHNVSNRFDIGDKVKDTNHVNLYGTIVNLKATVKWDRTGNHTDEEFDNLNDC